MLTKKIKVAIIAGLIGYVSSFPAAAESPRVESTTSDKVLEQKMKAETAIVGELSQAVQNQEMTESRHPSDESVFELFSLEGILSLILLSMFFLVFIRGQILKVD